MHKQLQKNSSIKRQFNGLAAESWPVADQAGARFFVPAAQDLFECVTEVICPALQADPLG
jgi:hypothetical protein